MFFQMCYWAGVEIMQSPQHHHKKADKTKFFVWLNKTDYSSKLPNILNDHTKLKKILSKDPTNQIKIKIFKNANNTECNNTKRLKIISDYKPGYLYRSIKIHKTNHPLRLIMSQVPTPIYEIIKTMNQPY